jgi:hypothetical protein
MRFVKTIVVLIVLTGVLASCAQTPDSPTAPLEQGPLTVWVVRHGTRAEVLRIKSRKIQAQAQATQVLPTTVQEQTAGSFGQISSNVGQTAGSYGQTAGSAGRNASDTGQTASSYGTTAGSFGTAASDHGQTAGSAGQTAGSFGQAASTYGQSLGGSSLSASNSTPVSAPVYSVIVGGLSVSLNHGFAKLEVRYVDVVAEELEDKLAAVEGKPEYPDVVLASALPQGWDGSGLGLTMLGLPTSLDIPDPALIKAWQRERVEILTRAPHPERARAFAVWMRYPGTDYFLSVDKSADAPARIAAGVLGGVLNGDGLGVDADAEAAKFKGDLARQLALGLVPPEAVAGLEFKIGVTDASANDRLAAVTLSVIASSPRAFGVMIAHVVLRKDDAGHWKVLQISPNVRYGVPGTGWGAMRLYTRAVIPERTAKIVAVSQAAPPDGDNRPPQPELWWDNNSDSGLLAVEWQMQFEGWTDSRMFLVPNRDPRVQTRVRAEFAQTPGKYRWRVWAIGEGGVVKLSPWREMNILR